MLSAFAKPEPQNAQMCGPQFNLADRFLAPVNAVLDLTDAQAQLLDKLAGGLDAASNSLVKSCPNVVAAAPIARLRLMDMQIGQLVAVLGGVRQLLQDFQHKLTDEQLARFAAMIAASSANKTVGRPENAASGCGGDADSATDEVISLIDRTVQPTRRDALDAFKGALGDAARDLQADCEAPMSPTELGRLDAIETRLETARRALRSIEAALTNFKATLNDEQRARLDAGSFPTQQ